MNERELFIAALQKEDAAQRRAYVDEACGADLALRQHIDGLLEAYERAGSFLEPEPPPETAMDVPASEAAGTMIGPYKLLQQIGEGGMGVVWMAEQTEPVKRKVALKVIKPGMDSRQVIARFEAERQALALMDHVNIARVIDGGTTRSPLAPREDSGELPASDLARSPSMAPCRSPLAEREGYMGRPYFVMELVHGVPITKYCDDNQLTPRERLELFVPVCHAIQHAHQKGIIHRDIKPSNVMVTLYDGKPVPKVIDFGVAKATEQPLTGRSLFTHHGTMVGTLEYMSPEQAEMSALGVDTRSDIYSLGVLLYELLTGSTPLTNKRVREAGYGEVLRMIKEEDPPRPSTRLGDSGETLVSISGQRKMEPAKLSKLLRGDLDWIVMKCLEKDRNRRYETANDLAADVYHYLSDEPVEACPPSRWYRFRKFAKRNSAALVMSGLVVGALLIATAVSVWQAAEATEARELADLRLENETQARAQEQKQRINLEQARAKEERQRRRAQANFGAVLDGMTGVLDELDTISLLDDRQKLALRQALSDYMESFFQRLSDGARTDPLTRLQAGWGYQHLAVLHVQLGDYAKAEQNGRKALRIHEALASEYPKELEILWMYSQSLHRLGSILFVKGETTEGRAILRRSIEQYRHRLEVDSSADARVDLAFLLVSCVDTKLQDPAEAIRLINSTVSLTPEASYRWDVLGMAQFRRGNWQAARHAFEENIRVRSHGNVLDFLYLAMIHWRLNEKVLAHDYYDRSVQWLNENHAERRSFLIRRYRAEAAALLGIDAKK